MAQEQPNSPVTNPFASKIEAIGDFVKRLCLAESLGRIYSINHPKGKAAVQDAFNALVPLLELTGSVPISMVEGKILVAGLPVEERNPLAARFINSFKQLYVDNLVFTKGLTLAEFEEFFRVLLQGAKIINASGGLGALLEQKKIANVQIQRVSYVLVHEDEKVVKRDAEIVQGTQLPPELASRRIVEYMVNQVLEKAEQRRWLINRIKNSPAQMAELITEGIELAISRAEAGLSSDKTIEGLLENIKLVCQSMVNAQGDANGDQAELQRAVLALETEIRARSHKLMSSGVAVGFVNELLTIITRYADQVRAEKISAELLKGEQNLRLVERLIRRLTPRDVSVPDFIERIRELMIQKGVTTEQIEQLAKLAQTQPAPRPRLRSSSKHAKFIDSIREQLTEYGLAPEHVNEIAAAVEDRFNRELRARTTQLEQTNQQLRHSVSCFQRALAELGYGTVIWDKNGTVTFADEIIEVAFGVPIGAHLSQLVRDCLKSLSFPIIEAELELLEDLGLGEHEKLFLCAIERVIRTDDGTPVGVLLRPTESDEQ